MRMKIQDYCDIEDGALRLRLPLSQYTRGEIVTDDPDMLRQLDMLDHAGKKNIPLTIFGEKGTGKDLVARYAHDLSPKARGPFIKLNCAYLPEDHLQKELFGMAGRRDLGLLQRAAGGTLYLENADLLPQRIQNLLINHIDGSSGETRFIVSLWERSMQDGVTGLIPSMIYHFNRMIFDIPPLRKRPSDVLLISLQQLEHFHSEYRLRRTVSPEVMQAILDYDWPGNTRQLTQTVERMAFLCDETRIDSLELLNSCIAVHSQLQFPQASPSHLPKPRSLKQMVTDYEIMIIRQYVEQYGSIRKAAAALDSSPATLSRKITEYNLTRQEDLE